MYAKLFTWLLLVTLPFTINAKTTYPNITVSSVVSVYDGDTIKVNIDNYPAVIGEAISIRILGIDAPEIRGKCASEKVKAIQARDYLRVILASASVVELHNVSRGNYFRLFANVIVDGIDVGQLMIEKQLAREYDGKYKRIGWCG